VYSVPKYLFVQSRNPKSRDLRSSECRLLLCDVSTGKYFPTFWRNVLPFSWTEYKGNTLLRYIKLFIEVKVKVTPVQELRLCTGRTAHRGSRGIALLFHDHGTRRG
jgi:hypothetical protein